MTTLYKITLTSQMRTWVQRLAHRLNQDVNPKSAGLISLYFHHTTTLYKRTAVYKSSKVQGREQPTKLS